MPAAEDRLRGDELVPGEARAVRGAEDGAPRAAAGPEHGQPRHRPGGGGRDRAGHRYTDTQPLV